MKEDRQILVETPASRSSGVWSIAIAAFVFITTLICGVIFSVYILNRIDSVEREVSYYKFMYIYWALVSNYYIILNTPSWSVQKAVFIYITFIPPSLFRVLSCTWLSFHVLCRHQKWLCPRIDRQGIVYCLSTTHYFLLQIATVKIAKGVDSTALIDVSVYATHRNYIKTTMLQY